MASQWKGKGKQEQGIKSPLKVTNWREVSLEGSAMILSVVKEAARLAPIPELKRAASTALLILRTIQTVRENKEAYERLGGDSAGLITVIWRSYKKSEVREEWLSAEMREILEDLTHTLESIGAFVKEQLSRNRAIRVIFSRADGIKINEYRDHLNYAMQKFELQSHMNMTGVLMQIVRKNDQLSEQILHRNEEDDIREARDREDAEKIDEEEMGKVQDMSVLERLKQVEMDHQVGNEKWHSYELKRIDKETTNRQSELERLRLAANAVEIANRLKKAQEEEIAELKRKIAGEEDSRRILIQAQSSKDKRDSRRKVEVEEEEEEEEEWRASVIVEEATSGEEEEVPMTRRSKVKRNSSKSPKRRPVALEYSTDDDEEYLQPKRNSKPKTARQKLSSNSLREDDVRYLRTSKTKTPLRKASSASLRVPDTEDESTDDEVPPPSRRSSKTNRKPRSSSGSPLRDVDDLISQAQSFGRGGGLNSGPGSPMYNPYFPTYGASFSPPMGPYGYGVGMPGTVVNSGVGNITNTNISNVGNDNSVKRVYSAPRSQRRNGY